MAVDSIESGDRRPRVLNFGSLNIDRVFRVPHLVRPGETLLSHSLQMFAGGKGANQSVALARAGAAVTHCGRIGPDGEWLIDRLKAEGIDTRLIARSDRPTGQAIIQVADDGQNAIVLLPGANQELTMSDVERALSGCPAGTLVLTQNETSHAAQIVDHAAECGFQVVFNPAPFTPAVLDCAIDKVAVLIVNESEGQGLTGETSPDTILASLRSRFPSTDIILTVGAAGVLYEGNEGRMHVPAFAVEIVDTTAAGDTFIGYFLTNRLKGNSVGKSLQNACLAAAISVRRSGAMNSIPLRGEVEGFGNSDG